jgi:hypothetical protein
MKNIAGPELAAQTTPHSLKLLSVEIYPPGFVIYQIHARNIS